MSDREYLSGSPENWERLKEAEKMIADGRGAEILFREYIESGIGTPVSAQRFQSLMGKGGDDDMFSSDFTPAELKVRNSSDMHACVGGSFAPSLSR